MSPIDFQVTRSKVKDKTAGLLKHVGCSLSPDPYAGKLLNVVQWIPLESRWPILMSRSWSKSNCWFLKQICLLVISCLLCWKVAKLGTMNALWFQLMFNSQGQRSCSNKCIFWLPCLKFPKHRTVDASKKEMFPIDFSGHFVKGQGQTADLWKMVVRSISKTLLFNSYQIWNSGCP